MSFGTRLVLAVVLLSLLASGATADSSLRLDAGWLLGAGLEFSSIATVEPAGELRYQRGLRNLMPAGPGEVHQHSVSCLVSITHGGASPTGPQESTRATSVALGRPGDRWLDTMRFTRIARATRDGTHGYEVSYDIAGHGQDSKFRATDTTASHGWWLMKVSTEELRRATLALLQHVEDGGQKEFEIAEDFYWDVPAEKRYAPYEEPKELTMGQLSDDWSEVTQMVNGDRELVAYGLVWLATVLRRVGEKAVG